MPDRQRNMAAGVSGVQYTVILHAYKTFNSFWCFFSSLDKNGQLLFAYCAPNKGGEKTAYFTIMPIRAGTVRCRQSENGNNFFTVLTRIYDWTKATRSKVKHRNKNRNRDRNNLLHQSTSKWNILSPAWVLATGISERWNIQYTSRMKQSRLQSFFMCLEHDQSSSEH